VNLAPLAGRPVSPDRGAGHHGKKGQGRTVLVGRCMAGSNRACQWRISSRKYSRQAGRIMRPWSMAGTGDVAAFCQFRGLQAVVIG